MVHVRRLLAAVIVIFLAGCTTLVRIESEPDDAKIYINGQPRGETPLSVELSNFAFNQYDIRLEKDGFEDVHARLAKEFKVGPFIGGLFLWPTLLWIYGPMDYQAFELDRE